MRSPERIDAVLDAVKEAWKQVPDCRLGQLVVNISRSAGYDDPFFMEDDRLMEILGRTAYADKA